MSPFNNTLAQPCQSSGYGVRMLQNRARAKFLSFPLAISLARLKGPLEKSYRNTCYCASKIVQSDGRLSSRYCKARWCFLCNRIRTANAIRRYRPIVDSWHAPHFVTLTLPTVEGPELRARITAMLGSLPEIRRCMSRTHKLPLRALRKLECTFSKGRFHAHLHLIVDGKQEADLLVRLWLKRYPEANPKAQHVVPCTEDTLTNVFKYFTKLTTEATNCRAIASVSVLDTIFQAMRGRRVWQPMGFTLAKPVPSSLKITACAVPDYDTPIDVDGVGTFRWIQGATDWVNLETGECKSGYEPSTDFREFVGTLGMSAFP